MEKNICLVGIDEQQEFVFNIFPNPANEYIEVQLNPSTDFTEAKLEIINLQGRKLKTVQISAAQTSLIVLDLTPGFYLLALSGNTVNYRVKRFLVTR